jgi:hypothetical protein
MLLYILAYLYFKGNLSRVPFGQGEEVETCLIIVAASDLPDISSRRGEVLCNNDGPSSSCQRDCQTKDGVISPPHLHARTLYPIGGYYFDLNCTLRKRPCSL